MRRRVYFANSIYSINNQLFNDKNPKTFTCLRFGSALLAAFASTLNSATGLAGVLSSNPAFAAAVGTLSLPSGAAAVGSVANPNTWSPPPPPSSGATPVVAVGFAGLSAALSALLLALGLLL